MYIPYKNKQANPSSPTPVDTVDCHDVQADVLATDISENNKISSLKQLKTETKIPTKAINALAEQLKNAQASASDAVQQVTQIKQTGMVGDVDLAQLVTDLNTLKTIVARLRSYHEEEAGYGDPAQGNNDDQQQGQGNTPDNPDNPQQEDPNNPTPIVYQEYDANGLPTKANAVYGMVLAVEGGGNGTWKRVDQEYNDITFDSTVHRTWANIREIENENGVFVEFPVTWVKSEKLTEGKYAGRNCWWTADGPVEGFHVHPAFMGADGNPHPLRISKYMASKNQTTNRPQSVDKGLSTEYWVHLSLNDMCNQCKSLNTDNTQGYRMYTLYDHHFLARLMLTEFGTPAVEKQVVDGVHWDDRTARIVYRGVHDPFGMNFMIGRQNYVYDMILDGVKIINGVLNVYNNTGTGVYVNTNIALSLMDNNYYPLNCMLIKGDNFDMGDLFFASQYTTADKASFSDMQYFDNDAVMGLHTSWSTYQTDAGPFHFMTYDANYNGQWSGTCFRISQVPLA